MIEAAQMKHAMRQQPAYLLFERSSASSCLALCRIERYDDIAKKPLRRHRLSLLTRIEVERENVGRTVLGAVISVELLNHFVVR